MRTLLLGMCYWSLPYRTPVRLYTYMNTPSHGFHIHNHRVLNLACCDTQLHVQECALATLHEMTRHKPLLKQLLASKAMSRLSQISTHPTSKSGSLSARVGGGAYSARSASSSVTGTRTAQCINQQCAILIQILQQGTIT